MNTKGLPLCKAYLDSCRKRKKPEQNVADFFFGSKPEKAASWLNPMEADIECAYLETLNIRISLRNGTSHICRGFRSEQRADGEFVLTCEIPPVEYQLR